MAMTSIAQPGFWPNAVERGATIIKVTRDHGFYFYSRAECGATAVFGQPITQDRAREIVESNPDGRIIGTSPVDWTPGAKQFTWFVEVAE